MAAARLTSFRLAMFALLHFVQGAALAYVTSFQKWGLFHAAPDIAARPAEDGA